MAQDMKENIKTIKSMEEDLTLGVKAPSKVMFMKVNGKKTDSLNSSINLDLCDAKVSFDTKWAFEDNECKERYKDKIEMPNQMPNEEQKIDQSGLPYKF